MEPDERPRVDKITIGCLLRTPRLQSITIISLPDLWEEKFCVWNGFFHLQGLDRRLVMIILWIFLFGKNENKRGYSVLSQEKGSTLKSALMLSSGCHRWSRASGFVRCFYQFSGISVEHKMEELVHRWFIHYHRPACGRNASIQK
ncbi:hypothetical protein Mapa_017061 [Marchantia paleacea]|nr:hypothetical protein Mapa_017061 [Marchantia paleacea]